MKICEIVDNVTPFPTKRAVSTVDVPPGYLSFYVKDAGRTTAHIMGIRPDGSHHQISTTTKELANLLASAYNQGGRSQASITPVSMTQAFGSDIEQRFEELGIKFAEKPSSWQQIQSQASASAAQLAAAEAHSGVLKTVSAEEFFSKASSTNPTSDARPDLPSTVKLVMPDGNVYVADRGGARSYYRMWLYVRPSSLKPVK